MHGRGIRVALLAILVAGGVAAGSYLREIERRADDLQAAEAHVDGLLVRLSDALTGIGTAQQSYVAPGQANEPSFERMSALVRQLYDDTATVGPLLRSPEAAPALQALADATDALIAADTRARENLRLGQALMAADVIFSDSRNTLDVMIGRLRDLRATERAVHDADRAALARERWSVLGLAAALTALVGLVFVLLPTSAPRRDRDSASGEASGRIGPEGRPEGRPLHWDITSQERSEAANPSPAPVDLVAAADICTDLSRITTTAALPGLLSRAAELLDGSGIILWMGAGEELFAVTAHGYRPQVIAQLGSIPRSADNATAAAWRTGQMTTVSGGEASNGAIVAPLFGPEVCIGVLAVEVRHHREHDPATKAVAAMIAAQLATAVSAWPAASAAQAPLDISAEEAAERARYVARQLAREFRSAGA
ncbi:MAG: GAF domain-containing protein [Acidobacteria bacterium]|nr:GAF domain-containing protein [Acidobacteriota bacterium]